MALPNYACMKILFLGAVDKDNKEVERKKRNIRFEKMVQLNSKNSKEM